MLAVGFERLPRKPVGCKVAAPAMSLSQLKLSFDLLVSWLSKTISGVNLRYLCTNRVISLINR